MNKQILDLPFVTQEQKYEYWGKSKEFIKQQSDRIAELEERIKSVEADKDRLVETLNLLEYSAESIYLDYTEANKTDLCEKRAEARKLIAEIEGK